MNDNQTRVAVIHGAACLAAIVLLWWLSSTLGWPTPVLVVLVVVLLGVVGVSAFRSLGTSRWPDPQASGWPTVTAPIPPASVAIGPVTIASSDVAYRFRFTATVHWQQKADDSAQDQNRRGADAQEALLDRAIDAAQAIAPSDYAAAGYRLAAALSEPLVAPRAAVQVWASDVRVDLAEEDSERLAKLERIQKDIRLWEQERAHEKEVRRYLGEDALASPGTALVWWLARHEDDIRGGVERIPDLTRISAVVRDLHAEPMLDDERMVERRPNHDVENGMDPGREDANSATATVSDEYGYGPAKPSAPADAARELLHGLFPQNDADRARAARHLALLVERWGQRDLAHSLRGSDGIPHDSDEALQAPSGPHDHIEESEPLSAPYIDNPGSVTDQADDEDNGSAGDPQR
jgi:SOS response regulatory protein OraA/RecX